MEAKTYVLKSGKTISGMAKAIEQKLINKNHLDTQILTAEDNSVIVQAKNETLLGKIANDDAITVQIIPIGENGVTVNVGKGQWLGKAVRIAILTAVLGAWGTALGALSCTDQLSLPDEIFSTIEKYLSDTTVGKNE